MWDGLFQPFSLRKHRDYKHKTYAEHEFENGARYYTGRAFRAEANPVTERLLDPPRPYYEVKFELHDGKEYTYLVPAEGDRSEPNEETVKKSINQYAANPVEGGRDYKDYVAWEETIEAWREEGVDDLLTDEELEYIRIYQPWVYRRLKLER